MKKVINHRLYISSTAEHYLLLTNVTRVELPDDNLTDNGFKLTIVFQQPDSGGFTVNGWPQSVKWVNAVQSVADGPNAITICNLITVDRGRSWIVELQPVGQQAEGTGSAANISVDDSQFENISGSDVQAVLNSVDTALGFTGGSGLPTGTADDQVLVYNQTGGTPGWQPTKLSSSSLKQTTGNPLFGYSLYVEPSSSTFFQGPITAMRWLNGAQQTEFETEAPISFSSIYDGGQTTINLTSFSMSITSGNGATLSIGSSVNASRLTLGGGDSAVLSRDQNSSLALVNGTTSQMLSIYNTSSSNNVNYRRFRSYWHNNTTAVMATEGAGSSANANINICLWPKGTGYIALGAPDGTAAGGDARGANAIDLQTKRTVAGQVAAGIESVILGGSNNGASDYGTVVGSQNSNAGSINSSLLSGLAIATKNSSCINSAAIWSAGFVTDGGFSAQNLVVGNKTPIRCQMASFDNIVIGGFSYTTNKTTFNSSSRNIFIGTTLPNMVEATNDVIVIGAPGYQHVWGNRSITIGHTYIQKYDYELFRDSLDDGLFTAISAGFPLYFMFKIIAHVSAYPTDAFDVPIVGAGTYAMITIDCVANGYNSFTSGTPVSVGAFDASKLKFSIERYNQLYPSDVTTGGNPVSLVGANGAKLRVSLVDPTFYGQIQIKAVVQGYVRG